MSKPNGQTVIAYFWRHDVDDPYIDVEGTVAYDPECFGDADGIAFHFANESFTISLPDLLEAIAKDLRR